MKSTNPSRNQSTPGPEKRRNRHEYGARGAALSPVGNRVSQHLMHYEQLLEDPLGQMQKLYEALRLGGFDLASPGVLRQLQSIKVHRPKVYPISKGMRTRVPFEAARYQGET